MRGRIRAGGFQQFEGADQVGLDIIAWCLNGMAHTCLRGQMDHHIWLVRFKQRQQRAGRFDLVIDHAEPCMLQQHRLTALL